MHRNSIAEVSSTPRQGAFTLYALAWHEAGFSPLPLNPAGKGQSPAAEGLHGFYSPANAPEVARLERDATGAWPWYVSEGGPRRDLTAAEIVEGGREEWSACHLGLALPPDLVVIDVDAYAEKKGAESLAALEAKFGKLPPTFRFSAERRELPSGRYLFRIPPGVRLDEKRAGAGIELLQVAYRYTVGPGSIHATAGVVRCYGPDGEALELDEVPDLDAVPLLPAEWIEALRAGQETLEDAAGGSGRVRAKAVSLAAVTRWKKAHTAGVASWREKLGVEVQRMRRAVNPEPDENGERETALTRHEAGLRAVCRLAERIEAGQVPASALEELEKEWRKLVGADRPDREAVKEFRNFERQAVADLETPYGRENVALRRQEIADAAIEENLLGLGGGSVRALPRDRIPAGASFSGSSAAPAEVIEFRPRDANGVQLPALLPAEFWQASEVLASIEAAAKSRITGAPDAIYAVVRARRSAFRQHRYVIPPIAGGVQPLGTFVVIVGGTGTGKSVSTTAGRELTPLPPPLLAPYLSAVNDEEGIGSGPGIAEVFIGEVTETEPDENGKERRRTVRRQVAWNAYFRVGEAEALLSQSRQEGDTVLAQLRKAWNGENLGQANATKDRYRYVPAGSYSLGVTLCVQPELAAPMFTDAEIHAGTPQRFTWFGVTDPNLTGSGEAFPSPIEWKATLEGIGEECTANNLTVLPFVFPAEVVEEVRERTLKLRRGEIHETPIESHRTLRRLKEAAGIAELHNRGRVTAEDWRLAGIVIDTSDAWRNYARECSQRAENAEEERYRKAYAQRAAAAKVATERVVINRADRNLANAAATIGRKVQEAAGPVDRQTLRNCVPGRLLNGGGKITRGEAVKAAIAAEWIVTADGGKTFTPGPVTVPELTEGGKA